MTRAETLQPLRWTYRAAALAIPIMCVVWAYWITLGDLAFRWNHDPQYSHGYLVPGFAVILLWLRRRMVAEIAPEPSWWGLPVLALGLAMRLVGSFLYYVWIDQFSLLVCLTGAVLMVGGLPILMWAWPSLSFLIFMIPLPYRVDTALAGPLQRLATVVSTFFLQTCGLPALADGNTILLDEKKIGIVEACSGLRMLIVFFALSAGMAFVTRRRLWEKAVIVASAVPIALASNVVRITVTGYLMEHAGDHAAQVFYHDLAGWFMMPLGLAMLGLELLILGKLMIEPVGLGPVKVGLKTESALAPRPRKPWKRVATAGPLLGRRESEFDRQRQRRRPKSSETGAADRESAREQAEPQEDSQSLTVE